jgi:hypothetical protein
MLDVEHRGQNQEAQEAAQNLWHDGYQT